MTEYSLIDKLTRTIKLRNPATIKGVGDDAAVIAADGHALFSTNILLEGVHFDLSYYPLKYLGYKAAVVNFADIYAMNARPKQLLVGLGVSRKFTENQIVELYNGIQLACEEYGVDIVGGDTTTSLTGLTLAPTAIGTAAPTDIVYRSGAQVNDLVCITGNLGAAYMGLLILEREKKVFEAAGTAVPSLDSYEYVISRYLKPNAPRSIVEALSEAGVKPTAMLDISKGLSSETLLLCSQSSVGVRLYLEKIPVAQQTTAAAAELNFNAATAALHGGEDYEMLFTLPLAMHDRIKDLGRVDVIGRIMPHDYGAKIVLSSGSESPLSAQGMNL